jgi:hypothetical protein
LLASVLTLACGEQPDPAAPTSSGGSGGAVPTGGMAGCEPGTLELDDGTCRSAGMTAEDCAEGFVHDQDACRPVLPAHRCFFGSMALLGEQECRPIAPCGSGRWGDIPTDGSTQHVDRSYQDGGSDGSAQAPWTSVQQGVDAASPGAIVAVAAGSYTENLVIETPVTVWGRCPELTTITAPSQWLVWVTADGSGTTIRGLELRGGQIGLSAYESDVTVEQVWLHGASLIGVQVIGLGNVEVAHTVRGSLIEDVSEAGVLVNGASLEISDSVVRLVRLPTGPTSGGCVYLQTDLDSGTVSTGRVVRSLIEECENGGIVALGSTLDVQDSVVRGVSFNANGANGIGIDGVADDTGPGIASHVSVAGSYVERVEGMGVAAFGATLQMERTVVREVGPEDPVGKLTGGVVGNSQGGIGSDVMVEALVVEDCLGLGVVQLGGSLEARSVVIRRLTPIDIQAGARGFSLELPAGVAHATATIAGSTISDVASFGIEAHGDVGVTLDSVLIQSVAAGLDARFGDGVLLAAGAAPAPLSAELRRVRIDAPSRAGVSAFGATVTLTDCELSCAPLWLNAEPWLGLESSISDGGGNGCSCNGETAQCQVSSTQLSPPEQLPEPDHELP